MKKILLLIMTISIFGSVYAQKSKKEERNVISEFEEMKKNFTESNGEWVFSKVIPANKISKDEIYNKALEALSKIYKDSKDVIQNKDKDAGIIIGKGFTDSDIRTINWASICRNRCWHLIKIEVKEGRYRVTITVSSLWNETGADLRHSFNGKEYQLTNFYPYWKDCKPKHRITSFDNLKFVYESSMAIIDNIENEINKNMIPNDEW